MLIRYELRDYLPRLSWCARLTKEGCAVAHGPWVETRPEAFVEGAWDGDFEAFGFDSAVDCFASGARRRGDHIVFATPTHHIDRLYVIRSASSVLVSNSWAFLLAETEDGPDLGYPGYFFDLVRHQRQGVSMGTVSLRSAQGRQVELFACCNIEIDARMKVRAFGKNPGPPPIDFADYRKRLDRVVKGVFQNATDRRRTRSFRPIAAISRGYDSVAAAALAAQAGCREALTCSTSSSSRGMIDDDGTPVAAALGMKINRYDREGFHQLPVERQAEWTLSPVAYGDAALALAEDSLAGSILVTGRRGETAWGRKPRSAVTGLRSTFDVNLSAVNCNEQRLRCGYIQFHPGFVAALHAPSLYRFNCSKEMDAWSIGQKYDRPTARRIAEEGGVPRHLFGQAKAGGAGIHGGLGPVAMVDFLDYYEKHVPPGIQRRLRSVSTTNRPKRHNYLIRLRTRFAGRRFHDWLFDLIGIDRLHLLRGARELYHVHWGVATVAARYHPKDAPPEEEPEGLEQPA